MAFFHAGKHSLGIVGVCGGSVRTTAGLHRDGGHCLTAAAATSNCLLLPLLLLQCRGATRETERFKTGLDKKFASRCRPGLCLTWARCRLGGAGSACAGCGRGAFRALDTKSFLVL